MPPDIDFKDKHITAQNVISHSLHRNTIFDLCQHNVRWIYINFLKNFCVFCFTLWLGFHEQNV